MNLGKFIFVILVITQMVWAEGVPFTVSSSSIVKNPNTSVSEAQNSDPETTLISDLKYLAVANWLQTYLGQRFTQFDKYITPDFAEKYIFDYKLNRQAQPAGTLELVGHLDGDSLKKWIRLIDSKSRGSNQIRPLFIVSSNLPGFIISPIETASRSKDSLIIQILNQMAQEKLRKLNAGLTPLDGPCSLEAPPKNNSEIQTLISIANRGNETLVVWAALTACPGCNSTRIDLFLFNTYSQNLTFVVGDDLILSARDLGNPNLLRRVLTPVFLAFQTELENAFSEDTLKEMPFKLIIDNIDSFRLLKLAETGLSRGNGFSAPIFKKAAGKTAEFEIKSALSIEELTQRIEASPLAGFKNQVTRVDGSTLVVRYFR